MNSNKLPDITEIDFNLVEQMCKSGDKGLVTLGFEEAKIYLTEGELTSFKNHLERRLWREIDDIEDNPNYNEERYKELRFIELRYGLTPEEKEEYDILINKRNEYMNSLKIAMEKYRIVEDLEL